VRTQVITVCMEVRYTSQKASGMAQLLMAESRRNRMLISSTTLPVERSTGSLRVANPNIMCS